MITDSHMPWMDAAHAEIGTKEVLGDSDNPRIVWYHSFTRLKATDDETAWCSAFVCAMLESTGWASTRSASARSYLDYGREIGTPEYGCIVVMSRGKPGQGHVGFYVGTDKNGDLLILGGNQGNQVCISPRKKATVLSYRWPVLTHPVVQQ